MRIALTQRITIDRPIDDVWSHFVNADNLIDFRGYGPIPGIARAELEGPLGVGAKRIVYNTDRSSHREEVVVFDPPNRIVDRIDGFDSPLRFLAHDIHDDFRFEARGKTTELVRTFTVELRSALAYPIALAMKPFLSRAIARHHERAKERLTERA